MKARLVLLLGCLASLLSAGTVMAEEGPVVIHNKYLEVRGSQDGRGYNLRQGETNTDQGADRHRTIKGQGRHHQLWGPWVTWRSNQHSLP